MQTGLTLVKESCVYYILSPSAIEASHPGLMRQFEQLAIITSTYCTHVHCCMPSEW